MENIEYIKAKTIVTKTKSTEWFGTEYNMNIYRGCCHGCIYCDSRSSCYRVDNFDAVRAKEDAITIIRNDLRAKRQKGVVGTGSMSDPYNPFEEKLMLTRHGLELLSAFGFGAAIATKSNLITRDIDILKEISSHSPVIAKITITAHEDKLAKLIEPNAPSSAKRFSAIRELSDSGIFSGILLMPILPYITDNIENILNIVRTAHEAGAKFIMPGFGVTLRENQRDYFYEKLDESFFGIKREYIKRYSNQYSCGIPDYKGISTAFRQECAKYGILYNMKDIIRAYKSDYQRKQISFFDF